MQYNENGALLRSAHPSLNEGDEPEKQPEEAPQDPSIHQEALIDEALEETFPASDPPAPYNET